MSKESTLTHPQRATARHLLVELVQFESLHQPLWFSAEFHAHLKHQQKQLELSVVLIANFQQLQYDLTLLSDRVQAEVVHFRFEMESDTLPLLLHREFPMTMEFVDLVQQLELILISVVSQQMKMDALLKTRMQVQLFLELILHSNDTEKTIFEALQWWTNLDIQKYLLQLEIDTMRIEQKAKWMEQQHQSSLYPKIDFALLPNTLLIPVKQMLPDEEIHFVDERFALDSLQFVFHVNQLANFYFLQTSQHFQLHFASLCFYKVLHDST
mmetsp:Transcript_285/g.513  ORF Transcript_285/g.513 Transcript_285/m.513 type:complete len:269 (-) Transcript_285:487-1293(-)